MGDFTQIRCAASPLMVVLQLSLKPPGGRLLLRRLRGCVHLQRDCRTFLTGQCVEWRQRLHQLSKSGQTLSQSGRSAGV